MRKQKSVYALRSLGSTGMGRKFSQVHVKSSFPYAFQKACAPHSQLLVEKLLLFYLHLEIYSYQNNILLRKTMHIMHA